MIATEAKSARDSTAIVPATITGGIPPDLRTGIASEFVSPGIAMTMATGTSVHVVPTTKETSMVINAITGTPKTRGKVFL
jgi:flavoprotein